MPSKPVWCNLRNRLKKTMSRIALNHSSYTNLLSLQQVTRGLNATQQILSTGRKVNSAIDNPSSYYTASSLNNRAKDLNALLDSMSQKTQTLTSALNGIDSATLFLEQMTSVAEQAILSINGRASFELTPELNDGYSNTQKIVAQYGKDAMAAYATTQFYAPGVDKNDEEFGQGKWYLPAIGELMQVYGTDIEQMTAGGGSTGALGNNKETINETLSTLASRGADAATLTEGYYWSSSERSSVYSWRIKMTDGYRSASSQSKAGNYYIRSFRLVENCFEADATNKPIIGDVMYADKSWGSASDYDGSKTAVGVITDVHDDGAVTIMSLKDLRFNGAYKADNFDPDHPYTSSSATSAWFTQSEFDVTAVEDYNQSALISALRSGVDEATADGSFSTHTLFNGKANTAAIYAEKGKAALMAYDARIFYAPGVGSSNSTFGKGKWYLPSVGELMNAYGYNFAAVGTGATSGATGAGRDKIGITIRSQDS